MARAKKVKRKVKGRDSRGNPVALQSKDAIGRDSAEQEHLAQRRGDGHKGGMAKEQDLAGKRPK